MDRRTAELVADARGQACVAARIAGRDCWLMAGPTSTLDRLAQCLRTDEWEEWTSGRVSAYDASGGVLVDDDSVVYEWARVPQPIEFRRMSWCVAVVSGMGRAKIVSRHTSHVNAIRAQSKRKHETTRVVFAPSSVRVGDEVRV